MCQTGPFVPHDQRHTTATQLDVNLSSRLPTSSDNGAVRSTGEDCNSRFLAVVLFAPFPRWADGTTDDREYPRCVQEWGRGPYGCVGRQRRRTGLWPGHDTQNYRSISKGIFIRSSEFTHFPIFFFNPCKLRSQMYCSFFLDDVLYIVETRSKTGMLSISSSTQVKEK